MAILVVGARIRLGSWNRGIYDCICFCLYMALVFLGVWGGIGIGALGGDRLWCSGHDAFEDARAGDVGALDAKKIG